MDNIFLLDAKYEVEKELNSFTGDKREEIMKNAVAETILKLCELNNEFAQAVAQGGAFADCMKAVCKQIKGNGISDIDAYCAAAAFYFPGCKVSRSLAINLCGVTEQEDFQVPNGKPDLVINLADFM